MSAGRLSRRELDRLAVLRVIALAYPDREKVEVFRADVLDLLTVVDRLAAEPRPGTPIGSEPPQTNVFATMVNFFPPGSGDDRF